MKRFHLRSMFLFAMMVLWAVFPSAGEGGILFLGRLELDTRSEYSHIRVYRRNHVRTMVFVRDNGDEAIESQVDLDKPYDLRFVYLRHMFASYLFRPHPEKVLVVGLGGGSMVHFLRRYDPQVRVDAVEIDPQVVRIAERYFGVRSEGTTTVLTGDGVKYLETTEARYDIIYMDAFLKPSAETDSTGVPLRSRTLRFFANVAKRLNPGGVVVFNLNPHPKVEDDLALIRRGFGQVYVFRLPESQGFVAVASPAQERGAMAALAERAERLDRRFGGEFSFRQILTNLERPQ